MDRRAFAPLVLLLVASLAIAACGGAATPTDAAPTLQAAGGASPDGSSPAASVAAPSGVASDVSCTGVLSDAFVASTVGVPVTPEPYDPATAPQLAPGFDAHVCAWRIPGQGALAEKGGYVAITYGSHADAGVLKSKIETEMASKNGLVALSGIGDYAYGPKPGDNGAFLVAGAGTDYVIVFVLTGGPDDSAYRDAVAALARETLARM